MILWHIILLAIVQGITEPLPISSSGHLALFHHFLNDDLINNAAQARQIDIAVHIGTLGALILFFWADVKMLFTGGIDILRGKIHEEKSKKVQYVLLASIPAVIAGYMMSKLDPAFFYDIERLAWMILLFGILMGVADMICARTKTLGDMSFGKALLFGLAQCVALIPGVSRSGITMTAGRFMGFDRVSAAKFSFWMAMVATAGAGLIGSLDVIKAGDFSGGMDFIVAIVVSFFTTYFALQFLMKWLVQHNFMVFVIYRVILGSAILIALYAGILA